MQITTLPNGNLKLIVSNELERMAISRMRDLQTSKTEQRFVKRFLRQQGFKAIAPEDCGALTSATLITKDGKVWGDMNYQVRSFVEELAAGNPVVFELGESA